MRRHRWVTLPAPPGAQSQLAEWSGAHEAFLTQTPRTRDRGEGRPLMIGAELRRTVFSDDEGEEVLLGQSRVCPAEERDDAAVGLERIRRLEGIAAAKTVEGEGVCKVVARFDAELVDCVLIELIPPDDIQLTRGAGRRMEGQQRL